MPGPAAPTLLLRLGRQREGSQRTVLHFWDRRNPKRVLCAWKAMKRDGTSWWPPPLLGHPSVGSGSSRVDPALSACFPFHGQALIQSRGEMMPTVGGAEFKEPRDVVVERASGEEDTENGCVPPLFPLSRVETTDYTFAWLPSSILIVPSHFGPRKWRSISF